MSPERPEVEVILQVDSPAEAERQEEMEVEGTAHRLLIGSRCIHFDIFFLFA